MKLINKYSEKLIENILITPCHEKLSFDQIKYVNNKIINFYS